MVLVPASVAPRAIPLLQVLAPTATGRANAVDDDDDVIMKAGCPPERFEV